MNYKYINIYNNLVNLTRNKDLYNIQSKDTFSDRLTVFLFHFAFFLKVFKTNDNNKELQEIYDYVFKQIELSIREIGYGDVTINKKMKEYLNLFHSILSKIDNWSDLNNTNKSKILTNFIPFDTSRLDLTKYFDKYEILLSKTTLNSLIKGVIKLKI
tara:strand:- start:10864 stop:11334 length:471 start_codon:yes stop_codon:yes gene_type:complete